ncbi:MAG: phenylacetate-CoA oxygenase/reductase subunit PaaK [Bacteroidetes bacterium]|nr:MAG: phenylacetate-CoA oxygenase/reductase subunit PaaK [Bacteroidota bacterium]
MSTAFYPLEIAQLRYETADTIVVTLQVPETLASTFAFAAGQHLTIKAMVDGQELRRNYSLCSSPLERKWSVAIKKVPGGLFSSFAHQHWRVGQVLEVMPPQGKFVLPPAPAHAPHYVGIAAGSGITPLISIIKTTLASNPASHFTLVYANKNRGSIIFLEALEALKNTYMQRFRLLHVLSRQSSSSALFNGRIDAEKCAALFDGLVKEQSVQDWLVCGPQGLTQTVTAYLSQAGVDRKRIHTELFGVAKAAVLPNNMPTAEGSIPSKVTITQDGLTTAYSMVKSGQTILEQALAQGANLPFACKGGVCCTCKAKLLHGQVHMQVHYGLEQDELDAGFVLTCQSQPLSQEVVLSFDAG